ncbi:hypothetical protein ACVILH_004828 [Bradyrhizobium sp. USDA 4353]
MTKRARTRFRVQEYASGKPFLVLEPLTGDTLDIFKWTIAFDLPEGTSFEDAQGISNYLNANLTHVCET